MSYSKHHFLERSLPSTRGYSWHILNHTDKDATTWSPNTITDLFCPILVLFNKLLFPLLIYYYNNSDICLVSTSVKTSLSRPFLRVDGIYVIFSSGLKVWLLLLLSKILSAFFTRSLGIGLASSHDDFIFKKRFSYSLFLLTEEGGYFRFWDSSQSFGFYLLPSPVRQFVRATICPCTPFFTHSVTKYKHLLVSILTWIRYFGIDLDYYLS